MKYIALLLSVIIVTPTSSANAIELGDIAKDIAGDVIDSQKEALRGQIDGQIDGLKSDGQAMIDELTGEAIGGGEETESGSIVRKSPERRKPGKVSVKDVPLVFGGKYHKRKGTVKFTQYKKAKKKSYSFKSKELPTRIWKN